MILVPPLSTTSLYYVRGVDMLKYNIEELRQKLNTLISNGDNYDAIYRVSVELDELITAFYKENC